MKHRVNSEILRIHSKSEIDVLRKEAFDVFRWVI